MLDDDFYSIRNLYEKINILLPYCSEDTIRRVLDFKFYLQTEAKNRDNAFAREIDKYNDIEHSILYTLATKERTTVLRKLKNIDRRNELKNISTEGTNLEVLANKVNNLERTILPLIERPKLYEARAEEKIKVAESKIEQMSREIDKLLGVVGKNYGVAEQIQIINKNSEDIEKIKQQAQAALNKIITVSIAEHYQEAKAEYTLNLSKVKYSNNKNKFIKYSYNATVWLLNIFKRIFQKDVLLYAGFIISLFLLAISYLILIALESTSYRDIALTIPLIWLTWFFQRKINTREKLYEIYNHKQKVMETYIAFMNSEYSIKSNNDFEEVILNTIKKDPSDCIGKDNTTIIEAVLDKLRGLFITAKAKRIIKDEIDLDK